MWTFFPSYEIAPARIKRAEATKVII